jgi:hypothetical protein
MWRRVDLVWTDVSGERIASNFRVENSVSWFLARRIFYPEGEGDTFPRNVFSHNIYTAPHSRRRHFSYSVLVRNLGFRYSSSLVSYEKMVMCSILWSIKMFQSQMFSSLMSWSQSTYQSVSTYWIILELGIIRTPLKNLVSKRSQPLALNECNTECTLNDRKKLIK